MYYENREQAAAVLAEALKEKYAGDKPLILGIPRGAVPMARIVADELNADMDILLVRKVGAPGNSEYAIGAVGEFGDVYLTEYATIGELPEEYIDSAVKAQKAEIEHRRKRFRGGLPPIDPADRTVIIVDDGIATGSTMVSAVRSVKSRKPRKVIVAAPVASSSAVALLSREADELVVLDVPEDFFAVSQFYEDFPQVTDDEVVNILTEAGRRAA